MATEDKGLRALEFDQQEFSQLAEKFLTELETYTRLIFENPPRSSNHQRIIPTTFIGTELPLKTDRTLDQVADNVLRSASRLQDTLDAYEKKDLVLSLLSEEQQKRLINCVLWYKIYANLSLRSGDLLSSFSISSGFIQALEELGNVDLLGIQDTSKKLGGLGVSRINPSVQSSGVRGLPLFTDGKALWDKLEAPNPVPPEKRSLPFSGFLTIEILLWSIAITSIFLAFFVSLLFLASVIVGIGCTFIVIDFYKSQESVPKTQAEKIVIMNDEVNAQFQKLRQGLKTAAAGVEVPKEEKAEQKEPAVQQVKVPQGENSSTLFSTSKDVTGGLDTGSSAEKEKKPVVKDIQDNEPSAST